MSGGSTVTRNPARKGRVSVTGRGLEWEARLVEADGVLRPEARVPRPASEPGGAARVKHKLCEWLRPVRRP